jgi:hypothetical protein
MDRLREAEAELLRIFRTSATKHEAHTRARPVTEQLSRDPSFLSAAISQYLTSPGSLDKQNYPVVSMEITVNPWFALVANCWIPLPGGETNITTKAIHHHGTMLLTTATLFGPGYEHWMFSLPTQVSEDSDVYTMKLLEAAPHPKHHVSFVDAWVAHTPLYPQSLSITLALWSNSTPTTWKDRVKRISVFRGREEKLRALAVRAGLKKQLDLKVVDGFDFYPDRDGFKITKDRKEFERGPNEDHLCSVFHVMQVTGNEHLATTVRQLIDDRKVSGPRSVVERLVQQLERGTPISGRLSTGHYDMPRMNFTRADIERALEAVKAGANANKGEIDGRKFASAPRGEAPARTRTR